MRLDLVNDIGIEVVEWPTLGIGNDCFYTAAATRIVVDSWGLRKSGGCLHILYFCIFFSYTNYNKHNTVVVTTFKLVEIYQGLFLGGNGDDSRRRKSTWADWADRAHTGLRDTVEVDDDDYNADNPERCLCRAKTMGFAYGNQKELRRTFF